MDKTMKIIKTMVKLQFPSSFSKFSTSSSLFTLNSGADSDEISEKQMFKNLYKYEKREKDDLKKELDRAMKLNEQLESDLQRTKDSLHKMKWPLYLRRTIQRIEEDYWVGSKSKLEEFKKSVQDLPEEQRFKEFTRRKWIYLLKNNSIEDLEDEDTISPMYVILVTLKKRSIEDTNSIEEFAADVAELKSTICEKLLNANVSLYDTYTPSVFNILEEKPFKDTIDLLLENQERWCTC